VEFLNTDIIILLSVVALPVPVMLLKRAVARLPYLRDTAIQFHQDGMERVRTQVAQESIAYVLEH